MANVIIYSTPTCPYCKLAKQYMDEHKVAYTNVDVSADPKLAEEMIKKSGQMGVPVIEVGDQIIVGFDKPALKAALGIE
jgi:glutaredoxin 3